MKIAVITFPASNCDRDMITAVEKITGNRPNNVWYQDGLQSDYDVVIIPGGFSYGDYLRCGAIASTTKMIKDIKRHAERGGKVLGVCNGFQILCESELLPGILMPNKNLKFICKTVALNHRDQTLNIPIAHHDGNYYAPNHPIPDHQILYTYAENPNGSMQNIAGVCNENGNVWGMMPHPERAVDPITGNTDGIKIFDRFFA